LVDPGLKRSTAYIYLAFGHLRPILQGSPARSAPQVAPTNRLP